MSQLSKELGSMLIDMYNLGMRYQLIYLAKDGESIIVSPLKFPLTILIKHKVNTPNKFHCTLSILFAMNEFYFETASELATGIQGFLHNQINMIESEDLIETTQFFYEHKLPRLNQKHDSNLLEDKQA